MKATVFFSVLLIGIYQVSQAQFLADKSPEGVSSLIGGTSIGFDLTKTSLRFDYTGKFQPRSSELNNNRTSYTNWGGTLKGGNNNSIAQLIKDGSFEPSTSASAFIFRGWNLNQKKVNQILSPLNKVVPDLNKIDAEYARKIKKETDQLVSSLSGPTKAEVKEVTDRFADDMSVLVGKLADIGKKSTVSTADKDRIVNSTRALNGLLAGFDTDARRNQLLDSQNAIQQQYKNFRRLNPYKRIVAYARLGTTATKFKYYQTLNTQNLSQSFSDTVFAGLFGELGVNYFTKSYLIFGLNVGYARANTLEDASPNTVTIQRVITDQIGQTVTTKRDITAYQGTFQQYGQFRVKGDAVALIPATQKGVLALNPYFRFATGANNIVADQIRLGINGYFFNQQGKFLGGLYIERNYAVEITSRSGNTTSFSVTRQGLEFGIRAAYLLDTFLNTAKPNG